MTIDYIDVDSAINAVKALLRNEHSLSPALRSALEVLLVLVTLLLNRITLNSKNSSKPPSTDPKRAKSSNKGKSVRKPVGQKGHNGTTLEPVDDPDAVTVLKVDRRTLPKGLRHQESGYESRQVIDIDISRIVTEYWAQVLQDDQGHRVVATFPAGVNLPVQYGLNLNVNEVYISQHSSSPTIASATTSRIKCTSRSVLVQSSTSNRKRMRGWMASNRGQRPNTPILTSCMSMRPALTLAASATGNTAHPMRR